MKSQQKIINGSPTNKGPAGYKGGFSRNLRVPGFEEHGL